MKARVVFTKANQRHSTCIKSTLYKISTFIKCTLYKIQCTKNLLAWGLILKKMSNIKMSLFCVSFHDYECKTAQVKDIEH